MPLSKQGHDEIEGIARSHSDEYTADKRKFDFFLIGLTAAILAFGIENTFFEGATNNIILIAIIGWAALAISLILGLVGQSMKIKKLELRATKSYFELFMLLGAHKHQQGRAIEMGEEKFGPERAEEFQNLFQKWVGEVEKEGSFAHNLSKYFTKIQLPLLIVGLILLFWLECSSGYQIAHV